MDRDRNGPNAGVFAGYYPVIGGAYNIPIGGAVVEYVDLKGFEQFVVDRDLVPEGHRQP